MFFQGKLIMSIELDTPRKKVVTSGSDYNSWRFFDGQPMFGFPITDLIRTGSEPREPKKYYEQKQILVKGHNLS